MKKSQWIQQSSKKPRVQGMMSHGRLRHEQRRLRQDCPMWWLGIPDDRELIALISLEGDEVQFVSEALQKIKS